jgi:plastocyanin
MRLPFAAPVARFVAGPRSEPVSRTRRPRVGFRPVGERLEDRALLATVNVSVQNFVFSPATVTIHQGDTVHWTWLDSDHSVTAVGKSAEQFNSGVQNGGFTFNHTFTQVGSFQYYCVIHGMDNGNGTASGMAGTITVMASGTSATLQSINVTPANASLNVGSTQAYSATGVFSDNSTQNITSQVTWASATPSVATISSAGLATGVAPGTSTISASMNGITGQTNVTVSTSQTPPAGAPTLVSEMRVFTGKGAHRKVLGFMLNFSTALEIDVAQDVSHYSITQPGRTKRAKPVNVPVRMAMYNPSNNSVMLMVGKFNTGKPLTLTATGLLGFSGTPAGTITTKL